MKTRDVAAEPAVTPPEQDLVACSSAAATAALATAAYSDKARLAWRDGTRRCGKGHGLAADAQGFESTASKSLRKQRARLLAEQAAIGEAMMREWECKLVAMREQFRHAEKCRADLAAMLAESENTVRSMRQLLVVARTDPGHAEEKAALKADLLGLYKGCADLRSRIADMDALAQTLKLNIREEESAFRAAAARRGGDRRARNGVG